MTLSLASDNPAVNPSPVFVPSGAHSASFTQSTNAVASTTTVNVTVTDGTNTGSGSLTLLPPQLTALAVSPTPIRGGLSTTGKVTLNAPAAVNTNVSLAVLSNAGAIASMPTTAVVPAGFTTGSWTIQTKQVTASTKVQISATLNGVVKKFTFTVSPITPSSLSFSPTTVTGGGSTTGTVNFPAAVSQDTVVKLTVTAGSAAVNSIPANVTVFAGSSKATFSVLTNVVGASTKVTVSASANTGTKSASFTVK
jgi:hypothetical protein